MDTVGKTRFLSTHRPTLIFSFAVYLALCVIVTIHVGSTPSFADAKNYMDAAIAFRNDGFLSDFGSVRTYGYPLILSVVSLLSGPSLVSLRFFSGLAQCAVYLGTSVWLASEVHKRNTVLSGAVSLGLAANVFNIVLLADTMTEAPSLIIALALTTLSLRAARAQNAQSVLIWLVAGSALAFFDFMIRPANIVVVAAWTVAGVALWRSAPKKRIPGSMVVGLAAVAAIVVLAPQIYYNVKFFHRFTPLPTADLGNMQARFGVEMMKYATSVSDDGAGPIVYSNPLYDGTALSSGAFHWYISHPVAGLGTIILHLFNSFNFDYLFVYIDDLDSPLSTTLNFFSWFSMSIGFYHIFSNSKNIRNYIFAQPQSMACLLFLTLVCGGTIVLNSTVAVENRFNLVPASVLIVSAVAFIVSRAGQYRFHDLVVCSFAAVVALTALAGSEWAKKHSATVMQARQAPRKWFPESLACGDLWDAAQRRPGLGFSLPEKDEIGPFRWTVAQTASIVATPCPGSAQVDVEVAFALTQNNVSNLRVVFGDRDVAMTSCSNALGTRLRGHVDGLAYRPDKGVELKLVVPKLDVIAGASREFGVAVRSIELRPDGAAPDASTAISSCHG